MVWHFCLFYGCFSKERRESYEKITNFAEDKLFLPMIKKDGNRVNNSIGIPMP